MDLSYSHPVMKSFYSKDPEINFQPPTQTSGEPWSARKVYTEIIIHN